MLVLLALLGLVTACTGPTPRETTRDADMAQTRKEHETPARPRLSNAGSSTPATAITLADDAKLLASQKPLARMQAANRLRLAGPDGVKASLKAAADTSPQVASRNFEFLASIDLDALAPDLQAGIRAAAIVALGLPDIAVRGAAAQVLEVHGAGDLRTDFLKVIIDPVRRVRWAVVRRFSDHPRELENAQLLVLVSFMNDDKLSSDVRVDVFGLVLAIFERLSKGQKPLSYDPYEPASGQHEALAAWEAWARSIPISPR